MAPVLDHLILLCSQGAPEADELVRLGLTEGSRNTHPGQGTANRRFFFENAYLELVWLSNPAELESEPACRLGLLERWLGGRPDACPFGLVLRPATTEDIEPPFRSWAYLPTYLPRGRVINIAESVPISEPLVFHFGFFSTSRPQAAEPTDHRLGIKRITGVSIDAPMSAPRSQVARTIESLGILSLQPAEGSLMTITFDNAARGAFADLRPAMPLALSW
jgi:hypothetical protein